jgi:hypothetical protein
MNWATLIAAVAALLRTWTIDARDDIGSIVGRLSVFQLSASGFIVSKSQDLA